MCSFKVLCAVVHPISSKHEQTSGVISCLSNANLQITVGVGLPAFSVHPFKKYKDKEKSKQVGKTSEESGQIHFIASNLENVFLV